MGLTIGLVGLDLSTGQARLTGGILQLADGIDIVVVAVGVFAIGEALWIAAHLRRKPVDVIPVGRAFMGRADWARSWKPWLRGTALGFPFGAVPAGGAETPTFLSYIAGEEAGEERRVRPRRHRGRGRPRGRQQRQRRGHVRAAAGARPAGHRDRRRPAGGHAEVRHRPRPDVDGRRGRPGLDPAGQPAHRQPAAAGGQPAAGARCGPSCCRSRGPSSTPASSSSPRSARTP